MLLPLSVIITEMTECFKARHVIMLLPVLFPDRPIFLCRPTTDLGIQILTIVTDLQKSSHMIDPGNLPAHSFNRILHAQFLKQTTGAILLSSAELLKALSCRGQVRFMPG